jgi:alkyl sulfatase BDS1-like metallo-beta-lactamase superfamily hydrolase
MYNKIACVAGFLCSFATLAVGADDAVQPKPATEYTKKINAEYLKKLPFANKQDFDDAKRGFVAALPNKVIKREDGSIVWDLNSYNFLNATTIPDTINPSLWRIAKLNYNHGLFLVTNRIYQVRGYDLSNMTIVEGDSGIIIIDPLVSKETAKAALDLYYMHRPKKPVVAVIYTHSHVDHFGGVKGVTSQQEVDSGQVKIVAPDGFLEEAISENVYAGNAMGRRAQYQYGVTLPRGVSGQVDTGLGKAVSIGETTLIAPTVSITKTGEKLTIDGVEMEFQMAPETEAPAEMLIYFPQFKALCVAEDLTHTLHNLYTLRGAQVRNAAKWWKTINETIQRYGDKVDVIFAQHHWPRWGQQNIVSYMQKQRDQFKYIHDQALNLMNQGYTMNEVANTLKVPESLSQEWYNRGYYGSVNHNAKAVYQRYLGWYSSNPADLNPLPPVAAGKKYVEAMGGEEAVLKHAQNAYDMGEYRWAAELLKHAVFANPDNQAARNLQADAFEQLGYQQENPTWRNEYLVGAYELRNGVPQLGVVVDSPDIIAAMTPEMLFDYLGISLNGTKASKETATFNITFSGNHERTFAVSLENGVLVYTPDASIEKADLSITWDKNDMLALLAGKTSLDELQKQDKIKISGNIEKLKKLIDLFDKFNPQFNIVTP